MALVNPWVRSLHFHGEWILSSRLSMAEWQKTWSAGGTWCVMVQLAVANHDGTGLFGGKVYGDFFKENTCGNNAARRKKKWCKQVLVWNGIFESTVEAPAPVITFKTLQQSKVCTSEASPWHNHKGQPVTTRHNSPVVHSPRKFWSFPTAKRQNAIYPSKSMPRPARGWRCFLKMYVCVCVCVGVAFSEKTILYLPIIHLTVCRSKWFWIDSLMGPHS